MALSLVIKSGTVNGISYSQDGTTIKITDKTGAYDASTNAGGWGSPNPLRSQSALLAYIVYVPNDGDNVELSPSTSQIIYDSGLTNSSASEFSFTLANDGRHQLSLVQLPVSTNGTLTVAGATLVNGDYFYMGGSIYQKGTTNILITDYSLLLDDSANVAYTTVEELVLVKTTKHFGNIVYPAHRIEREKYCEEEWSEMQKIVQLLLDQVGADYAFEANPTQSEDIVETLISDYEIE